ncbi:MAG: MogA/MoaB family molybdenum cofactor biosynthesis protein [Planctomycetota bacterium]|jgi:molybdenum cofactor synthesis domain-containing protein
MGDEKPTYSFGPIRAAVVTVSDRRSRGEGEDLGGPLVTQALTDAGIGVAVTETVADDLESIQNILKKLCRGHDLVITTGGTGIAPRDVTPDATRAVMDREIPGMAEAMRRESAKVTPHAMISRAVCAVASEALIVNLPGSPKGAVENLQVVLPAIPHAVRLIKGRVTDCAEDR